MFQHESVRLIALTGGIGAGKSIISSVLRCEGFPVYDCDSRAKALMDVDAGIRLQICRLIHHEAVRDGVIDRRLLADIVFADEEKLRLLNSIVHEAVRNDIKRWSTQNSHNSKAFVETAILYQSRLDRMVEEVWEVTAPTEVRIARVMRRNALSREEVIARVNSQDSYSPEKLHPCTHIILNDGVMPVLPRIKSLLQ